MIEPVNTIEYNERVSFTVDSDCSDKRLDKILSEYLSEYSRSFVQNLFTDGLVECNGKKVETVELSANPLFMEEYLNNMCF